MTPQPPTTQLGAPAPQVANVPPPARAISLKGDDTAWVEYLSNGSLLLVEGGDVYLHDGSRWHERHFEGDWSARPPSELRSTGIFLSKANDGHEQVELLSPVDLRTIGGGLGRQVGAALVIERPGNAPGNGRDDERVVFERAGNAVQLVLPRPKLEVLDVNVDPNSDVVVVTFEDSASNTLRALRYSAASGAPLGDAAPMPSLYDPTSSRRGNVQYYLGLPRNVTARPSILLGSSLPPPMPTPAGALDPLPLAANVDNAHRGQTVLAELDLTSGRVTRRGIVRCAGVVGNPIASPDASVVAVTCDNDLLVLDGRTFAQKRRIKYVLPGCDNGMILSGNIVRDRPAMLEVEGCGGIARLNLDTARYECGDSPGVLGGEYEMMAGSAKPRPTPRVPACSSESFGEVLPLSPHYGYHYEREELVRKGAQPLSVGAHPSVSADETRVAFVRGSSVVVLELPSGKPLALP